MADRRIPDKLRSVFAGVIPAEPGWRVILTDGKTTYSVAIVGWSWERKAWTDDDTDHVAEFDPVIGEPVIVDVEGGRIAAASDVCSCMTDGFRVLRLVAPKSQPDSTDSDGWQEIATESAATET